MQPAALLFVITLTILLAPFTADACTCEAPGPAPCEAVWDSPVLFSGEVLEITPVDDGSRPQFMPKRRVRFRVDEMWRGEATAEVVVTTRSGGGDCGYDFKVGGRYLVYTYAGRGYLETGTCSRTQRLDHANARDDFAYLATIKKPSSAGRIFGTVEHSPGSTTGRSIPASGYVVTLRRDGREWARTDATGRYEFTGLQPGPYEISIELRPGERVYGAARAELRDARGCAGRHFSIVGPGEGRTADRQRARRAPAAVAWTSSGPRMLTRIP